MNAPNIPDMEMTPLKRALIALKDMGARLEAAENASKEPVAIIGMACRFPGPNNSLEGFWELLRSGGDAVIDIPSDRWDVDAYYDPNPETPGKMYTRQGGFLKEVDKFDAGFFRVTPREANSMDPQQRLLLEVSWQALENAGIAPGKIRNSLTGVFVGISTTEYSQMGVREGDTSGIDAYTGTGGALSVASGRLSFFLRLRGPAVSIDTACSSSLVAIDQAVQYLRARKCNMALAGGVNLIMSPESTVYLSKVKALSTDGRCKAFDASADGYGRGEGCGIVVLKRLSDALAEGDRIIAVIRGSAVNHDGHSSGLTVPNGTAQQDVISAALANADLDPSSIHYIEAHGTGTELGDPIEIRALSSVFSKKRELIVGTAKTNIGHLESAAGIAAVIKVALALQNRLIPPSLHFKQPSAHIAWDKIPIRIATELTPWPADVDRPMAGVSSFGFSGTNAHLILQAAPPADVRPTDFVRPLSLLPLSAHSDQALYELTDKFVEFLGSQPRFSFEDICFTAGAGRDHFAQRIAVVADSVEQLQERLTDARNQKDSFGVFRSGLLHDGGQPKIAFLFTGQGSQYADMGRSLFDTQPVFRASMETCDALLEPYLKQSLLSMIYPPAGKSNPESDFFLEQTENTQPILFALEYSLAQMWLSWGIKPAVVCGHSVGEYVAACIAGIFSLKDGLRLIAERARLMQKLPATGKMAAVFADGEQVAASIAEFSETVSIAALNGPANTVISGAREDVQQILDRFASRGVKTQDLKVSHAFHSPLIETILPEFAKVIQDINHSKPGIRLVSNLTGKFVTGKDVAQAQWWCRHARETVRFADSMQTLIEQGIEAYVEVGPHPVLMALGQQYAQREGLQWLPTLRRGRSDWQQVMDSLARLYVQGAPVDWERFDRDYGRRKVPLPGYPFQRERFWHSKTGTIRKSAAIAEPRVPVQTHPLLGQRLSSPLIEEIVFSSVISAQTLPYLKDHRVFGSIVFPATAYIEMALAAARSALEFSDAVIENMVIEEPLILHESQAARLQIALASDGIGASFRIFGNPTPTSNNPKAWTLHASGSIQQMENKTAETVEKGDMLEDYRRQCFTDTDVGAYYRQLDDLGINYGFQFRSIENLWQGDRQGLGRLQLSDQLIKDAGDYEVHPALLDGCLQILGVALLNGAEKPDTATLYLPIEFRRLKFFGRMEASGWCHARIMDRSDGHADTLEADLDIFGIDGNRIATFRGLICKEVKSGIQRHRATKRLDDWLFQLQWQSKDIPAQTVASPAGHWLIFADRSGLADELRRQLALHGARVTFVYPGKAYRSVDAHTLIVDPFNPEDFKRLISSHFPPDDPTKKGILHLWSLENTVDSEEDIESIEAISGLNCGSVLHLIQALSHVFLIPSAGLWLVTRGAQMTGDEAAPKAAQAPLWGMGRVIAIEQPELRCTLVDLDPGSGDSGAAQLMQELQGVDGENQIAFREGKRLVPRLVRFESQSSSTSKPMELASGGSYQLVVSKKGVIDNLEIVPTRRITPGPGQVEIEVLATGLNFRDVLNVLDMYPGEAGALGSECVGWIASVGQGVSTVEVGDKVLALAWGSFSKYVVTSADLVFVVPDQCDDLSAAGVPIVFLTAYYGLYRLANIKKGDRVLIHAAAGGVGMAAVQLAKWAGAEVFGTAGSMEKQKFIQSIGVDHVMNSRTLDFADQIMGITNDRGVDIVLNALAGDFIPKSLSVLAPGGRFIEIGKAELWDKRQVAKLNPAVTYTAFDLSEIISRDPQCAREMFANVMKGFSEGSLKALPVKAFPIENAVDAFRFMAQARHIGKIVITQKQPQELERPSGTWIPSEPQAACLITGGFGAIGHKLASWLVDHGIHRLVLMGRSEPGEPARKFISGLEEKGASVIAVRGDVTQTKDVMQLFEQVQSRNWHLCGIIHAAGILNDGVLIQQKWEDFQKVLAPKIKGAWLLHQFSKEMPLDFFVMFSSAAAVFGSPGQGAYAAANAFMDSFGQYLRAQGARALSVNWGPWAEQGMAASLKDQDRNRLLERGIEPIDPDQGASTLDRLLGQKVSQAIVLPVEWSAFLAHFAEGRIPPVYEILAREVKKAFKPKSADGAKDVFRRQLAEAPESARRDMIIEFIAENVAKVMGLPSAEMLNIKTPFSDMGLDSLMAVELRNALADALGHALQASLIFDYSSIEALSDYVAAELLPQESQEKDLEALEENERINMPVSGEIEGLSQEEIARLLIEKIASLDQGTTE